VQPHVAENTSGHRSAVPDGIAYSDGYGISMQCRKRIEQGFGWANTIGQIQQVMAPGLKKVDQMFALNMPPTTWCACARWDRCVCRRVDEEKWGVEQHPHGSDGSPNTSWGHQNRSSDRHQAICGARPRVGPWYFSSLLTASSRSVAKFGLV